MKGWEVEFWGERVEAVGPSISRAIIPRVRQVVKGNRLPLRYSFERVGKGFEFRSLPGQLGKFGGKASAVLH